MRRQREAVRLTKRVVDAAACPADRKDMLLFDAELRGFCLRVTQGGGKVFLLQYKANGKVQRLRLGEYGVLTVEQARKRAEDARGQVAGGGDPKAVQIAKRAAARAEAQANAFTLRVIASDWRRQHLEPHRKASYAAEAERVIELGFPKHLDKPAEALTPEAAREQLEAIAEARGQGAKRRTFRMAHAAFAWAVRAGLLKRNPLTELARPPKAKARERALTDSELGEVWRAAAELSEPFSPFLKVLLLTLQRREEVAGMRWSELTPDRLAWNIPGSRTKNARPHVVHLAPAVREILEGVPRMVGSDFIFTTTGKSSISGYSKAKARLDALIAGARRKASAGEGEEPAEFPAWRLHDLRRTGVTAMARLGVLPDVADRILNHAASATTHGVKGIYQVHDFAAERAEALRRWRIMSSAWATRRPDPRRRQPPVAKVEPSEVSHMGGLMARAGESWHVADKGPAGPPLQRQPHPNRACPSETSHHPPKCVPHKWYLTFETPYGTTL